MTMINYNKERNEVEIWGCSTCPFGFETPKADANCELNPSLNWSSGLLEYFPNGCPLRDPNFKLVRHIEEQDNKVKEEIQYYIEKIKELHKYYKISFLGDNIIKPVEIKDISMKLYRDSSSYDVMIMYTFNTIGCENTGLYSKSFSNDVDLENIRTFFDFNFKVITENYLMEL